MANWRSIREVLVESKLQRRASLSWFRKLPRTSFLFDENVQTDVVRAIRASGMRIDSVREVGLARTSDEDLFAIAWGRRQMLVTYDRDFILRIPDIGHDLDFFWSIVRGKRAVADICARSRPVVLHKNPRDQRPHNGRQELGSRWRHHFNYPVLVASRWFNFDLGLGEWYPPSNARCPGMSWIRTIECLKSEQPTSSPRTTR
jgi:hypothetical protein